MGIFVTDADSRLASSRFRWGSWRKTRTTRCKPPAATCGGAGVPRTPAKWLEFGSARGAAGVLVGHASKRRADGVTPPANPSHISHFRNRVSKSIDPRLLALWPADGPKSARNRIKFCHTRHAVMRLRFNGAAPHQLTIWPGRFITTRPSTSQRRPRKILTSALRSRVGIGSGGWYGTPAG